MLLKAFLGKQSNFLDRVDHLKNKQSLHMPLGNNVFSYVFICFVDIDYLKTYADVLASSNLLEFLWTVIPLRL